MYTFFFSMPYFMGKCIYLSPFWDNSLLKIFWFNYTIVFNLKYLVVNMFIITFVNLALFCFVVLIAFTEIK